MSEPIEIEGTFPEAVSWVAEATGRYLRERREQAGPKPTADGTRGRGSAALSCARHMALGALHFPKEHEWDGRTLTAFRIGVIIHEEIQATLKRDFYARCEVPISYRPTHDLSGNADGVYDTHPETGETRPNLVTVEIKSMTKYAWMLAQGKDMWGKPKRGALAGPKDNHICQAAMYADSPQLQSDWLHMIYYCKDNGDLAEWLLHMDAPLAHLDGVTPRTLARRELARNDNIWTAVDAGRIPRRHIPGLDPGELDSIPVYGDKEGPFLCRVCDFNTVCQAMGKNSVSIERGQELLEETGIVAEAVAVLNEKESALW